MVFSTIPIFSNVQAQAAPSGVPGSIVLGTGNYLRTVDSSDFVMGSGDFTLETWVHPTAPPSSGFTGIVSIGMPSDLTNGINGYEIRIGQSFLSDGKLGFMAPNTASNGDVWTATASALAIGQWTHLALVRSGSTMTLYVNGVSSATRTGVAFTHTGYPAKSGLGAFFISKNGGWGDGEFLGSVADVRLVKGTAVYTSNFTPPRSQLGVIGGSNTKMLLNTNYSSGNTLSDFAFNAAPGGLQPSGGGSPSSSSVSPYLPLDTAITLASASTQAGASDANTPPLASLNTYTVEGWLKPDASCIGAGARCEAIVRDGDYDIAIYDGVFKLVFFYSGNANTGWLNTGVAPQAGVWTHVAATRSGTATNFYVNGVLAYSYTLPSSTASNYSGIPFRVGFVGYGNYYYDGQIDEVKLWNVARTQAQIASTLYSAPTLTDSSLLAYYDFNTGYGSTVVNRKVGAATTSYLTLSGSPSWGDVKVQSTSGVDVTIKIPRSYINSFGGFSLPSTVTNYDYLVVGGGGGGGNGYDTGGGGGGGGGMVRNGVTTNTNNAVIAATVGVGGAGGANSGADSSGTAGDSSSLGSITSLGGGAGSGSRTYPTTIKFGGSKQNGSSSSATGGNGGGAGGGGGGGGGAVSAGGNGVSATAGSAGSGLAISLGSITATYGAGGAGAAGGSDVVGAWALLNTGNGGGAGSGPALTSRAGGSGGSGMIIIHYATSSSLTLTYSVGQPIYRTVGTITATAVTGGKVSFYERGKIIAGCQNRPTNGSNVATCSWKPSTHGIVSIVMVFVATGGASGNATTTATFTVAKRTGNR
jgi:hypothetical protein